MIDKICQQTKKALVSWNENYASKGVPIDIANSVSLLLSSNILTCIFGEDLSHRQLTYREKDTERTVNLAFALKDNFLRSLMRMMTPQLVLFP